MKLVYPWLRELVAVPDDVDEVARAISLRGFEIAAIESGPVPVVDFEITANRPDCLSHVGLAREASAIWNLPLQLPPDAMPDAMPDAGPAEALDVTVEDAERCPRYCAQVFEVRIGRSPAWLAERLVAAGVRPINNVVDITNYVMLEIGQPMHAFDLAKLSGRSLVIRRARAGETLRTLDGVDRALDAEMLVIADGTRAAAVGGVMGGHDSEIDNETTMIALESAYFDPGSVRRASRRLGLKTEASIRFERGGDVAAAPLGIRRAAALLERLSAGRPRGAMIDRYPSPVAPRRIELRRARIARLLGQDVPPAEVERVLAALGFEVAADGHGDFASWRVTVPTFRVDVAREADLIEEVGRHYGFDKLPLTFPALRAPQPAPLAALARDQRVRRLLAAAGWSEAITFTFIEKAAAVPFCEDGHEPAPIANPLSEKFAVLRPSLLPGLVDACAHNRRREIEDVRLFESGSRVTAGGEGRAVAFVWAGDANAAHWSGTARAVDFFDAKGVVEQVCGAFGVTPLFAPLRHRAFVDGRGAAVSAEVDGAAVSLGVVGQLTAAVVGARGIPPADTVYGGELDLTAIGAADRPDDLLVAALPKFPSIVRDVSLLVDLALPAAAVRGTIRSVAPPTLVAITEFDRYQGTGIPDGRLSLSLRLTFRAADRTLTDEDAQEATDRIVDALRAAHGAERR